MSNSQQNSLFIYIISVLRYYNYMIQYILLFILISITLINIYSFTFGKKIKKNNEQQFNQLKIKLEQKSVKILKTNNILVSSKHFFVSDINEGFLLIFDFTKQLFIIITEDGYDKFYSKDVVKCENYIYKKDKSLLLSKSIISTNSNESEYIFGTKKRKASSLLGKFIIESTEQFTLLINNFIKEKN